MHTSTSRLTRFAMGAAILLSLSAAAAAQQFKANSIVINQPWARATPGGAMVAAGYMTITNTGAAPDRLIGGALPQAGRFEVSLLKTLKGRESLEIFTPPPYRRGHDHNSFRPRFTALVPCSQPRFIGA
jgi:Copper chaperone PCu(A)C